MISLILYLMIFFLGMLIGFLINNYESNYCDDTKKSIYAIKKNGGNK